MTEGHFYYVSKHLSLWIDLQNCSVLRNQLRYTKSSVAPLAFLVQIVDFCVKPGLVKSITGLVVSAAENSI